MGTGVLNRFGIVSDEIDADPKIAFAVAHELGMESVDLNSHWGQTITELGDDQVAELGRLAEQHQLSVYMVAGSAFKSLSVAGLTPQGLLASAEFGAHMAVLERSLAIARQLGAHCARVFSFKWPHITGAGNPSPRFPDGGEIPDLELKTAAAGLRAACRLAERYDLKLGLENVRACYANSGRNSRRLLDAVGEERLELVWDPANGYVSGEARPYPDGYEAVRPYVKHVHMKDAVVVDPATGQTAWRRVGDGALDVAGQLGALAADDYRGVLCLETHWRAEGGTREQSSRLSYAALTKACRRAAANAR